MRSADEIRKAKRESMARMRAADIEKARSYKNNYHAANREKQKQKMRDYYARRFFWGRAMKLRGPERATPFDLASIWRTQRGRCALTGFRLDRTAQLDHRLARARGGSDQKENLRWLCKAANLARREFSDYEFYTLCLAVVQQCGIAPADDLFS